jgi:hypothetical protein
VPLNSIKQLNNLGDSVTYNSGEIPVGTENIRLRIVIFMCSVSKMLRTNIFRFYELELIPETLYISKSSREHTFHYTGQDITTCAELAPPR